MNWEAIGAIGEVVGAVAVIVSILYLAAQVRQGAADIRANIISTLHTTEVDLIIAPAADTVLALGIEKAHTGGTLTDEERAQYSMWIYGCLVHFQQVKIEYDRLKVDDDLYDAELIRLTGMLRPELSKAVYRILQDRFTQSFRDFVEQSFGGQRLT